MIAARVTQKSVYLLKLETNDTSSLSRFFQVSIFHLYFQELILGP